MKRVLALALAMIPTSAAAQAVQLAHYRAAETPEDAFALSRPTDLGHLRFGARFDLDYAYDALVYERVRGDSSTESASIVEHLLVAQLGASVGLFERLVLHAGLPVHLVMDGESVLGQPGPDGPSVGDLRLAARGRLLGERSDPFAVALQLTLTFPTAQGIDPGARFAGEDGATLHPEVLAELRPGAGVRVGVNLGARMRATDRARFAASGLAVGHELTWALGVMVPVVDELELGAEVFGSTPFEAFGDRAASPVEALLGARLLPVEGLSVGLAAGLGLARGYGAPDVRVVVGVGWVDATTIGMRAALPEDASTGGAVEAGAGADGGGDRGAGADGAGGGSGGAGGAEQTGSAGAAAEADRDRDLVPDARDGAPDEPEDRDGWQDEDGAPDPDDDADGVLDLDDGCPRAPGAPEEHGCPRAVRVDTDSGRIFILRRVEFETNRAEILPESVEVLEEVRAVLAANPQLRTIRVEGHTDDRGLDAANLDLSTRRTASVIAWLVEHGVPRERLTGVGCGELHPIETNGTPEGRRNNRRVEFHILDPAPEGGARALEGCREAP